MAEKKALLVLADALDLNGSGGALDKLKKKAAVLSHADAAGLKDLAVALGVGFAPAHPASKPRLKRTPRW